MTTAALNTCCQLSIYAQNGCASSFLSLLIFLKRLHSLLDHILDAYFGTVVGLRTEYSTLWNASPSTSPSLLPLSSHERVLEGRLWNVDVKIGLFGSPAVAEDKVKNENVSKICVACKAFVSDAKDRSKKEEPKQLLICFRIIYAHCLR